jgi:hypothetical protein
MDDNNNETIEVIEVIDTDTKESIDIYFYL